MMLLEWCLIYLQICHNLKVWSSRLNCTFSAAGVEWENKSEIRCISIQISLSFFLESALSWQLSLSSPLLDTGRFCDFKSQSQTFSLRNVFMFSFPILPEMCRVPLYVSFSASFESRLVASHQENSPEKPLRSSCCHFHCHHHYSHSQVI